MNKRSDLAAVLDALRTRRRFVISSHAKPDGDSIGSQLAMAYALRHLGKEVVVVNKDAAAPPLQPFPGVSDIRIANRVDGEFDAAILMECGDLGRPGVAGLDRFFLINIDHHPGNAGFGQINWFDASAAACTEMVFDVIEGLQVPLSREMALHIYLGILTDTGSFHYSSISPRTFEISKRMIEAGVDPVWVARTVYDSNTMGGLRLLGTVLGGMRTNADGTIGVLHVNEEILRAAGGTADDTEGLVNLPLTVKAIVASVFFKHVAGDEYRVSLRSKGPVDVGAVAKEYGGGGHKNAAGCTVHGAAEVVEATLIAKIEGALTKART